MKKAAVALPLLMASLAFASKAGGELWAIHGDCGR